MINGVPKEILNKPQNVQEEIYLNFDHRPQRIIIYNLLVFIWSISNLLFYSDVVSNDGLNGTMYSDATNGLLLFYHIMITVASFTILFIFYYQFKIKDLNTINISFSIGGNHIELPFIDGINLLVGLIYFLSFLFHFAITWKMCSDICQNMHEPLGCGITIISSTLFSMAFPLIWATDIVDNFLANPTKRILCISALIFLSTFPYIFEFILYHFGENTYYLSSYLRFAQTSFFLISAATAIIYICEGFYHEGVLKQYFEIMVSFVLLCSPLVAYSTNIIQLNDHKPGCHETYLIIVALCIFISYDLQRLDGFKLNVIGKQSTPRERLITAPQPDFGGITTPSFMKNQYEAPSNLQHSINGPDIDIDHDIDINHDIDRDIDRKDDIDDDQNISNSKNDAQFSYLVFKQFSFKLDNKKQRLLLFNTLLLIYGVAKFILMFNFWVNYDKDTFKSLQTMPHNQYDFAMHLKDTTYELYCISFVIMIIISVAVIFMEWFIVSSQDKNQKKKFKFYRYSCCFLYLICGISLLVSVISGSSDYCKYLDRTIHENGENYYCHMQYVATEIISILLPLAILSIDILDISKIFYDHTRVRVNIFHLIISLSSLLFYVGFYNYYPSLDDFTTTKLTGLLMIVFSFIFSALMSPLFIYLESNLFSKISNFIASLLIIIGVGVVISVNNISINISNQGENGNIHGINVNISNWALLIPISCLVSYEIQILK